MWIVYTKNMRRTKLKNVESKNEFFLCWVQGYDKPIGLILHFAMRVTVSSKHSHVKESDSHCTNHGSKTRETVNSSSREFCSPHTFEIATKIRFCLRPKHIVEKWILVARLKFLFQRDQNSLCQTRTQWTYQKLWIFHMFLTFVKN